jgi:hypothetical protein
MEDFINFGFCPETSFLGHTVTFPCVRTRTSRETCAGVLILYYSYNKSHQDALFLNFILVKNYTFFGHSLFIIRSLNTVFTANGLLARSGWNPSRPRQQSVNITSMANTSCCEYSIKTPNDEQ